MENYLPSKKFVLILLAVLVIGAIAAYGSEKVFGNKEKISYDKELSVRSSSGNPDKDKDGLPDWEEALWGTDPNNATTNGDTPDSVWVRSKEEEVMEERQNRAENPGEKKDLNSTDLFLQEFLLSYTKLKASGNITPEATAYLSDNLVQSFADQTKIEDTYTAENIVKVPASKTATATYKNSILSIAKRYNTRKIMGTELEIFADLLGSDTKDTKDEEQLVAIATAYKAFAKELMKLSVPENMVNSHVVLVNDAVRVGIAVEHMAVFNKDALLGLQGLSQYEAASSLFEVDIDSLASI